MLSRLQYLQMQVAIDNGDFATFDSITGKASSSLYVMADAAQLAANKASIFSHADQKTQIAITALEAKDAFALMAPEIDKCDKLIKQMGQSSATAAEASLALSPEGKMGHALEGLGIKWDKITQSTDRSKIASAEYVAASTANMDHATRAWETMNSEVDRLAKVNLPAALAMQEQIIASMERMKAPWGEIQAAQQKSIDLWMKEREQASATGAIEVSAIRGAMTAYNQMASTIASNIVNLKSFGETATTILKSFAQEILTQAIGRSEEH